MTFLPPQKHRMNCYGQSQESYGSLYEFLVFDTPFKCVASTIDDWEKLQIRTNLRFPTHEELVCIKNMFWSAGDAVIQVYKDRIEDENTEDDPEVILWRKKRGYTSTTSVLPPGIKED